MRGLLVAAVLAALMFGGVLTVKVVAAVLARRPPLRRGPAGELDGVELMEPGRRRR